LVFVLDGLCRLLHPIMPFLTEQGWQALNQAAPRRREAATGGGRGGGRHRGGMIRRPCKSRPLSPACVWRPGRITR
jgi:hypothetical protein